MASLEGKTAIVTGASSGIGAATARALEEAGARVAVGSRHTDGWQGPGSVVHDLDVTDEASSTLFVRRVVEELGEIDVLVNNAGLGLGRDPVWESSDEDERTVIETNVLGLMRMTRLCLPHIADGGHIVNLGSVAGIWSYANGSSYVASKFAVHGYTRALRDDLHGRPIHVTLVAPGLVETNFSKVRFKGDEEKAKAVYKDVALGGPVRPEDVADCIVFAVTRPPNVNVDEIVVMALAQTSGANILREG
ncbi:MAG: SDR family NAD(P)-dependent oxidoreductase [Gaiellaceae bacterium]